MTPIDLDAIEARANAEDWDGEDREWLVYKVPALLAHCRELATELGAEAAELSEAYDGMNKARKDRDALRLRADAAETALSAMADSLRAARERAEKAEAGAAATTELMAREHAVAVRVQADLEFETIRASVNARAMVEAQNKVNVQHGSENRMAKWLSEAVASAEAAEGGLLALKAKHTAGLESLAARLGLLLPADCDPYYAIGLDIDRLQYTERMWGQACDIARAHCPVDTGLSHIRDGIPKLAKRAEAAEAKCAAMSRVVDDARALSLAIDEGFASGLRPDVARARLNRSIRELDAPDAAQGPNTGESRADAGESEPNRGESR